MTTEAAATRPAICSRFTVAPPVADGGAWILKSERGDVRRLGKDLGRYLVDPSPETIWNEDELALLSGAASRLHLHCTSGDCEWETPGTRPATTVPRIAVPSALKIQLNLLRFSRDRSWVASLSSTLTRPLVMAAFTLIVLGGLIAGLVQGAVVIEALNSSIEITSLIGVLLGVLLTSLVHEFAHAVLLLRSGVRPRRFGVMLFFFVPAFFCEVTEAWRLPPRKRVAVALGGVFSQLAIAGAAMITAVFLPWAAAQPLIIFAVVTYITAVFNLIPFIKLDGYLALMGGLDKPFLLDHAKQASRRVLSRTLFGSEENHKVHPAMLMYGIVSAVFPFLVLVIVLRTWLDMIQGWGLVGSLLIGCLMIYIAWMLVSAAFSLLREMVDRSIHPWKSAWVLAATAVGLTLLMQTPLQYSVVGAYQVDEVGDVKFLAAETIDRDPLIEGATVEFRPRGLITTQTQGTARLGAAETDFAETSPLIFGPVDMSLVDIPLMQVLEINLDDVAMLDGAPAQGQALVEGKTMPLWEFLLKKGFGSGL